MADNKDSKQDQPKEEVLSFRVVVDPQGDTPTHYVNHAEVGRNIHEFAILLGHLPAKIGSDMLADAAKSGQLIIKPSMQLLLPPTLVRGLIKALEIQLAKYEDQFGPIKSENVERTDE